MPKGQGKSTADIQRLLDEKRRIEQWLERLDIAADKTSKSVRLRVATDYRERLDGVVRELQGFRNELAATLADQVNRRDKLRRDEAEATERLSEAELRHAVGEYSEAKWSEFKTEILESLVQVREHLKALETEIGTLEGVVVLLGDPESEAEPALSAMPQPPPLPAARPSQGRRSGAVARPPEPPKPSPAPVAEVDDAGDPGDVGDPEEERNQTDAFDELDFLKSVSVEQAADGGAGAERDDADLGVDYPLAEEDSDRAASIGAEGVRAVSAGDRTPTKSVTNKKTLKCAECGAMNLPTEWYCERCGAELAAL
jgi:hypothetical protein